MDKNNAKTEPEKESKLRLQTINKAVYNAIQRAPLGLNVEEISIVVQVPKYVCVRKVAVLKAHGMIYDTGVRRKTRHGIDAPVYKASEENGQANDT